MRETEFVDNVKDSSVIEKKLTVANVSADVLMCKIVYSSLSKTNGSLTNALSTSDTGYALCRGKYAFIIVEIKNTNICPTDTLFKCTYLLKNTTVPVSNV